MRVYSESVAPWEFPTCSQLIPNPYKSPKENPASSTRLFELRALRNRWSRRCWIIGGIAIFLGFTGFNFSQILHVKRYSSNIVTGIDIAAASVTICGFALILFSSLSWFWFRNK